MQDHTSPSSLENAIALQKYGVGQPVRRKEDDTLVRGKGKYTDDFTLPGQAYCWMVRSSHAHGIIRGIDTAAAKAMPGVLGVWTGKDLEAAGYNPFTCGLPLKSRDGSPLLQTNRPALATDKVRFVGDPVAFVVAETLAQARDAAEAVELDIEPLPAVTDAAEAAKPGAPQLYDHIPNNVALDYHYGDTAKIDAAFASAAHVTRLDIVNTRVAVVSMEPRVALAAYDKASERFTLQVPTQGVAGNKAGFAKILNVPTDKVRILTANVGGSFGMKNMNYPEYTCIAHAAKVLGRPVKWTDERSTSFLSDSQGRAQLIHAELALDAEGKFLAVRLQGYGNLGAYITGVAPGPLSLNTGKNLASVYRTPLLGVDIKTVLTNTTLMGAYRGAGRPEANYYMERLIDRAADEMGINRLTLRKRNFIKPSQLPFAAASGVTYDSGDFAGVFNKALEISDHANFARRKKESRKNGKLRGIAVGSYLEVTAPPSGELGKITFEPDGSVKLTTGTLDYGQGHATPFAQVLSAELGVPFEKITLEQGDSDLVRFGNGTGGSRSITATGQAIVEASALVVAKGKQAAAHLMEASEGDIEFAQGRFTIAGTDRSIGIMELAQRLREGKMPEGAPRLARRRPRHQGHAVDLPQWLPCRGSRDRSRDRRDADRALFRRQRFRHRRQPDDRRRPVARRRGARHRPGADGGSQLRFQRPADHRLVHGLRDAARGRHPADGSRRPSLAGKNQSAGHQGLRRSRLRRQPRLHRQRGGRRAVGIWHHPYRHAADAGAGVAGDPGCEGEGGVRG